VNWLYADVINRIYLQLYGRQPNADELSQALAGFNTYGSSYADTIYTNAVQKMYQEVWGRPIDAAYLDYYTFLLSTDGTLADVRADMEALHLQMVVLPVLIAVSLIQ
jgi:hypothetical protein